MAQMTSVLFLSNCLLGSILGRKSMNTGVHYVGFALKETPVDRLHDLCSVRGLFSCIPFMTDEISILLQDSCNNT
ncbi:hypothetical protein DER44DRAFT_68207 [Fusarium oxysporum]|nr:hypothetical protein DER44DRAFT_68207 [Fusarium oxysporum]